MHTKNLGTVEMIGYQAVIGSISFLRFCDLLTTKKKKNQRSSIFNEYIKNNPLTQKFF